MADKKNKKQSIEDLSLDSTLRPKTWNNYIGQDNIKKNLDILIKAAQERKETVEHMLFYGPAGLGKTTLAHIVAKEMGANLKISSGPAIEKVGDLASILTNLSDGDVLFIDEAHRLNKTIEEVLYPAMENRSLNIIIGKGPSARIIQLELPSFTLIAATTRIALLSSPLRSRFSGGTFRMEFYSTDEIRNIIERSSIILKININKKAAEEISERSRFTPRTANRILKRCRDVAQIDKKEGIDEEVTQKTFNLLGVDNMGLEKGDRNIIKIIINKFSGGPVGLQTIAAATSEDASTIEDVYEPYLLQLGFIERTPKGRLVTPTAYEHLGLSCSKQNKLL